LRAERRRTILVRGTFALLAGWAAYSLIAQSGEGVLQVEIRDHATGAVTPAMVCITSLADKSYRTPPDGRSQPRFSTVPDFMNPPDWKPGEIGPVRLTSGYPNDGKHRLQMYEGLSDYPFWQEPAAYFVSQPFSITVPVGKWRLAVERGIEYLPVYAEFEIRTGETRTEKVELRRWVEMAKQGWYSGDDHVHFPRLKPEQNEFLMTWARAEDVHLCNILRMGDIKQTYFEQAAYGKESRYQQGDYALVTGQEDPRTDIGEQGHTIGLNIKAPVRGTSKYHLYDVMFDGVHAQGGLTGYAHEAWAGHYYRQAQPGRYLYPTWDPTINLIRGKVDFLELLQFRRLGLDDFYDFLNLGVKLIASSGSDLPWGNTIGETRVYAYTGPHFSVDAWFDAFKRGRTFVTNGPMLTLMADQQMPGDEVKVRRNATVRIHARAWAPAEIGTPEKLELIAQGRVLRTVEGGKPELKLDYDLRAEASQWIAARVSSSNGALAHTSPIYMIVDGRPFVDRASLPAVVQKRLKTLDFIEGRLGEEKFVREYAPGEVEALRQRVEDARARYKKLTE
jgi:hypothetical protein